jgi:hypothetical protein
MPALRLAIFCFLALALPTLTEAKDKAEKSYPQHGRIISIPAELHIEGDADRGVHDGKVKTPRSLVYLLHTEAMDYQIEDKGLSVGDEVSIRTENNKVYIRVGSKERDYRIVGQQRLNPPTSR